MEHRSSCFFIGHRETPDRVYPTLLETIERHIAEYGVSEFVVGQYGNFDRLVDQGAVAGQASAPGYYTDVDDPILPSQQKGGSARGVRRSVLSAGFGNGPQTACHRPRKPIHGGAQRFCSSPMCGIRPATPENCWSMLVREREKEKSTSQIWLRSKSLFQRKQMM